MTDPAADVQALITETDALLADFRLKRDQPGLGQFDRERHGIEAAACAIRLKALRECLSIITEVRLK